MSIGAAIGSAVGGVASAVGSVFSANAANKSAKDIAKKGVQWRVNDAIKAGVHPLAALGMAPAAVGPGAVGDFSGLANAGSALGDAVDQAVAGEDKVAAAQMRLQTERMLLDNELLRSQIASQRMRSAQTMTPGIPGGNHLGGPAGILPDPFGGKEGWKVKHSKAGQALEDAYGEGPGQWAGSLAYWAADAGRNAYEHFTNSMGGAASNVLRYMTLEKMLTPADSSRDLLVDAKGNIYDVNGNVIGRR